MLLALEAISYRVDDGRIVPAWLGTRDESFVDAVLDAVGLLDGFSVGEAEAVGRRTLARVAREARMVPSLAEGLWAIERRRWETNVDAPVDPESLRDIAFELSARLPRDRAIEEAARRLGIPSQVVVGSLFADRQTRRILRGPSTRTRASELVARYNVAVVQSLLARSMDLEASIVGDPSFVIAAAKRDGLLVRFEAAGDAVQLSLVGPLAIFHDTAKYGRSIARFVPSLLAAPRWSLRARVSLGGRAAELHLADGGAIAFARSVPAAPDGRLARRVARALRPSGVHVDLHPPLVRSGQQLVFPDFALSWDGHRVLVDIVPFATADYLERKAEAVASIGEPMLVCVEERSASMPASWILPYRRQVDPWALFSAARGLVGARASKIKVVDVEPSSASRGASPSRV